MRTDKRMTASAIRLSVAIRCRERIKGANNGTIIQIRRNRCAMDDFDLPVYTMTKDEQAQIIGYFAAFPESPVALYLNFGRSRLEIHRLFPPQTIRAYRRERWGRLDGPLPKKQ